MWIDDIRARVEAHPDWTAFVFQGRHYSYRELWERSAAAGAAACRDQSGARHWVANPDPLTYVEAVMGAWIHGKVPVAMAPDLARDAHRRLRDRISRAAPTQSDPERREALIMGTSGSTGVPKLAVLPHAYLTRGIGSIARWYELPEGTQAVVATAINTATALLSTTMVGLSLGWTIHLFPAGTPGSVLQAYLRANNIAVMNGPSSFFRLFFQYGSGGVFPSLRCTYASGEPGSFGVLEQMHTAFPNAKTNIVYGMTEVGRTSVLSIRDPRAGKGGCGVPLPHFETRLIPIPGIAAPTGELLLRGPTVMLGYLQEDGSYAGLDEEGFLHSGDMMRPDPDGCLCYLGRMGGLVKVGGLMANPREVEQALLAIPGVADALCWAEPHALLGNAIAAMVVRQPGVHLDERALRRACADHMEKHKVPRSIAFVDKLPETPAGKRGLKPTAAS